MSTMSIRPRGIGEILDGAFRLYKEDVGLYVLTATLAALPWAFFMIASVSDSDTALVLAGLAVIPALVLTTAVWAALMHQMNERLEGRQPAFGSSMKRGVRLFFRVLWGGILAYVVIFGAMIVWMGATGVATMLGGLAHPVVGLVLAAAVGIGLLIVFWLRVVAGAALFLPGIVVEGLGGYRSLKRGFDLSKDGRSRIITVLVLSWVLILVPLTATYFVTGTSAALVDPDAVANGLVSTGQLAAQQILAVVASGFTTPFMVACVLLLYYDQRVRREAYDLEAEADALAG